MLHYQTLEKTSHNLLTDIMQQKGLEQAGFVLVGGTALALQIGHRMSTDIDLFTDKPFDPLLMKQALIDTYKDRVDVYAVTGNGLRGFIDGVKIDMVYFHYPNPFPIKEQDGIRMLSLDSLAAMKIHAVGNRGLKRDFVDLAELLQKKPLNELMASYQQQFNPSPAALSHLKRGLTYFGDAEATPQHMDIKNGRKWEQVKDIVLKSVKNPNAIQTMKAPREAVAHNPHVANVPKPRTQQTQTAKAGINSPAKPVKTPVVGVKTEPGHDSRKAPTASVTTPGKTTRLPAQKPPGNRMRF